MSETDGVVQVVAPEGESLLLRSGENIVFGRDPSVGLPLPGDPWLSRRAGEICVLPDGVRVSNLSERHALFVQMDRDRIRLPPMEPGSCFLVTGKVGVGSAAMLDQSRAVRLVLPDRWQREELVPAPPPEPHGEHPIASTTELPIRIQADTKEFMVAFVLCRPWLEDPARTAPLPSAPQIAEAALQITGAHHLLKEMAQDTSRRDALAGQVHEHLKGLRAKLKRSKLVRPEVSISPTVIASTLLHYDVIGPRHLALLNNPDWLTAQENKWWGPE